MDHTYIKFYEDEYRTLQLLVRDMQEEPFNPDTATCHIKDSENEIVMEETTCMVIANAVRVTIPSAITNVKGLYKVLWTIWKDGHSYKHKTILNVEVLS